MEALLACSDQRITPTFDLVFRGEDVLPLAPLLALGLAEVLLQALWACYALRAMRAWRHAIRVDLTWSSGTDLPVCNTRTQRTSASW